MVDLSVEVAGIQLKNPLMVGAGPNTKNRNTAIKCMKAGFGAIVVRSLHMQHLNEPQKPLRNFWNIYNAEKDLVNSFYSLQSTGARTEHAHTNIAPGWGGVAMVPTLEEWAEEVRKITSAAREYDCAVIASIGWCGSGLSDDEVWIAEAKAMTAAGVDAIELHTAPSPGSEPGRHMMLDSNKYLERPIRLAKAATNLPVFAKLTPDCCDIVAMANIAQKAGADGIVPTTRWSTLPIDIEHDKNPVLMGPGIGGPWSAPIMNGFIFRIRHADQTYRYIFDGSTVRLPDSSPVTIPIIASGGVQSGATVMGYLIAGANAAQICSQVIIEGAGVVKRIEQEIRSWMERKGYQKVSNFQNTLRLLRPEETIPWWLPVVDKNLCNACGNCARACANDAITLVSDKAHVDESYCEGCRTCFYVCPTRAISLKDRQSIMNRP